MNSATVSSTTTSKEQLVAQLREVFVLRGYDGATLANLAQAAGLSKASLYHHFPGGKPEMAAALVRHAIADLQQQAFRHLTGNQPPRAKLLSFIDGFSRYTQGGQSDCLLAVFNHHSTATEQTHDQQQVIAQQFDDWHATLATVFEEQGMKPKKARQAAYDLLGALYGALLIAKMHNRPELFTASVKRLRKQFKPDA